MDVRQPEGTLVLAGRFRCDRVLKRGGGVDTWLATDLDDGDRPVVVKTVAADGVAPATRARLEHEAAVLRRLEGPSIQPLVASDREGHFLYLVQPFVEGITLRDRLAPAAPCSSPTHCGWASTWPPPSGSPTTPASSTST